MKKAHHTLRCWYLRIAGVAPGCTCSYDVPPVTLGGQCVRCERIPPCDCPLKEADLASA